MAIDIAGSQILSQPVSGFLQGRAIRQAEDHSERKMQAFEAAESREAEAFELQKQDRQAQYDEITAKKAYAGAQQVLALPKGQRKDFVAKAFPELVKELETKGYGSWDEIDEDELEEMATMTQAQSMKALGMSPAKPETFTLKPGEQRFSGDKVVAENTAPEEDKWTNPEPVMIGGKKVMAQINERTGEPRIVPGATPIEPAASAPKDESFAHANVLRDEFVTQSKDFTSVDASYSTIQALAKAPSAAGDIGLLTSYMRMVDPGSTVREGEFATAQNAGGVPDRIRAQYNSVLRGERLSDAQRKDFVGQAKNMFEARKAKHQELRGQYRDLATRAKVDPLDVIGADPKEPEATTDGPIKVNSDADYASVPSGARYIAPDGSERTKR